MVSNRDLFSAAGPVHLTSVNWDSPEHQRIVVASLVQGVCVLERDRQWSRHGSKARARDWWESFGFKVFEQLIDDIDSIFGAIYQFSPPDSVENSSATNAPTFVIALRGTIMKKKTFLRDLILDASVVTHDLHRSRRIEIAMQAVTKMTDDRVWLAGHSLGASIATLVGKKMVWEKGIHLKTFLFNPPMFKLKRIIRIAKNFITAGLTLALHEREKSEASFISLSSWVPNLFLNSDDLISSGYIAYFKDRNTMERNELGDISRIAVRNSSRDLLMRRLGMKSEPVRLLASANVAVNSSESPDSAHGIHQWFKTGLILCYEEYRYR